MGEKFPQHSTASCFLVVVPFSREAHHVFDFSSSVFHSIFIAAVLLLFVLFVVGQHNKITVIIKFAKACVKKGP